MTKKGGRYSDVSGRDSSQAFLDKINKDEQNLIWDKIKKANKQPSRHGVE